ncbi:MAG: magnesium transporter [Candidatus Thermoplasmatota archaeon]|jgi:magnesium transporter|nr:magnesium transporter [Candidatus Thermoplasmatota archaeon]
MLFQVNSKNQSITNNDSNNSTKNQNRFTFDEFKKSLIKTYVNEKKWNELRTLLVKLSPATVAEFIEDSEQQNRMLIFKCLPYEFAANVFSELKPKTQEFILKKLTNEEASSILSNLTPDDRTALFEELPAQVTKRLFQLLKPEDQKEASQLLAYPENSVGRLMTPDFIAIHPDWTVENALKYIREKGKDSEILSNIYIVDDQQKLIDDIRLRQIILAKPTDKISDLMNHNFVSISAYDDQEKAYYLIKKSNLFALPVVDSNGKLLGIVTVDDLIDVGEEETTEDFHKIAAMSELKLPDKIRNTPVSILYRKRIGWLLFLVFVNIFSGAAIALFQETIAKYIILVLFMPLLVDCGGNAGSQASTLMVRALAIKDVTLRDWYYCIGKEILVAGALGLTMGLAVSIIGIFRGGVIIALVVSLSMVIIVFVGSLIGISLPFIFTRIGWDSAVASGPLITSIADIVGIILYFLIASMLLGF